MHLDLQQLPVVTAAEESEGGRDGTGTSLRWSIAVAVIASLVAAPDSLASAASSLRNDPVFDVDRVVALSAPEDALPLGFYHQIVVSDDGAFYLSGVSGGTYPPAKYRVLAFDKNGRFVAGRGPKAPDETTGGVAFLLGIVDDRLQVVSKGLGEHAPSDDPWQRYEFSRDLRPVAVHGSATPGTLVGLEVVAIGPRRVASDSSGGGAATRCLHAYTLAGDQVRDFGECPANIDDSTMQIAQLAAAGDRIYWMHFRQPQVRITDLAGTDVGVFGTTPRRFVSYESARDAVSGRAGSDSATTGASLEDIPEILKHLTQVKALAIAGHALIVTWRLPNKSPEQWWNYGSIVQVYDLRTQELVHETELPLRLLGADSDGGVYWHHSVGGASGGVRHSVVRAKVSLPVDGTR